MRTLIAMGVLAASAASHGATIYLCKAYNGSTFWAQAHCNQHNALIERIESVADVPWDQQVQQAEQARGNRQSTGGQPVTSQPFNRLQYCAQLANERRQIEGRYDKWQWQPPEVINPDQQRTRAINAQLRSNNCPTQ